MHASGNKLPNNVPVWLVIPAYNEAERIGDTLNRYSAYFGNRITILVVLNGCTDTTADVVRAAQREKKTTIHLLEFSDPIGKGGALREGFRAAQGDPVGFVDADGSTAPEEFDKLSTELRKGGGDGVIASRWHPDATVLQRSSRLRRFVSTGLVVLVRSLFGLSYTDTQCGAKVFQRRVIERVLPMLRVHDMMFDVELLYAAKQQGFTIREVPTVWVDKKGSSMLGSPRRILLQSLRLFGTLLTIRFRSYTQPPLNV